MIKIANVEDVACVRVKANAHIKFNKHTIFASTVVHSEQRRD